MSRSRTTTNRRSGLAALARAPRATTNRRSGLAAARRVSVALLVGVTLVGVAGCGGSAAVPVAGVTPQPSTPAASSPADATSSGAADPSAAASSGSTGSPALSGQANWRYVFPVVGTSSYAHTHHDYPATDIMAACGTSVVSPVNGVVLEVTRVDTWTARVNAGATRGGLAVSILGEDGVRYYGSHFSAIDAGVDAGVALRAGQQIAKIGKTGDASACHIHFGLSPVCARTGDWWNRRGVIWPWSYLDAWRGGVAKSPVNEIMKWKADHGCPTKALVDP
jgi:murein DD-endopeptidase MepM/ murein hydrolase activator NlpD